MLLPRWTQTQPSSTSQKSRSVTVTAASPWTSLQLGSANRTMLQPQGAFETVRLEDTSPSPKLRAGLVAVLAADARDRSVRDDQHPAAERQATAVAAAVSAPPGVIMKQPAKET